MNKFSKTVATSVLGFATLFSSFAPATSFAAESETSNWTREDASKIVQNKDNTAPEINTKDLEQIAPDYHIWDTWLLRNKDGSIATVNGYKVIFSLTAPSDVLPGKRHDIAEIRYFVSKNGKDWELGGTVFNEEQALGSRQWAGSAMIEDGEINFFYTATGRKGEEQLTYEQRLVKASADVDASKKGVEFTNWSDHEVILEPDGEYYQTMEQSKQGDIAYAFRDPWFFEDPKTGEDYILFEGNSGGTPAERSVEQEHIGSEDFATVEEVPEESKLFNGSIGIAKAENDDYTEFEIMPPLMEANSLNQELERPHIVTKGNKYYLFTDTHKNKFAPGTNGPDGLYGFVSNSLTADYEPLNGSGLVVANPENEPYQTYSWMVMPNGTVVSFANFYDLNGLTIDELGAQSEQYQFDHFGGTLAPSLKLSIHNDETKIVKEMDAGVFK
ncbi:glycoside hydrolase family 68 protein [Guptibacillus hwajinpoensis]|uniref:glycoside hydrolase family 68 protein n=1 Tax=Guptibacillus hwajinpoensis TaxID=208199 RepID=UPI00273EC105|nr:glycoside hydrolase family 68 protein [Pseudalkalibacillus hwajinpoensis]WLR58809.1 glycoside hydrolase family 68 protein [Pseudalkalibacillus hwajinpoensis]